MRAVTANNNVATFPGTAEQTEVKQEKNGIILTSIWVNFLILYLVWDYFVNKNKKIQDVVDAGNVRTNVYNIVAITFAAVLGINGIKILLVKIGGWAESKNIRPLVDRLLPLFQL